MELVKKNILSIICGVVALAAIAFHLVYTTGAFSDLETRGKERAAKEGELQTLLTADYRMPTVGDASPQPLGQFPNDRIIRDAQGVVAQLTAQARSLVNQAVAINRTGYNLIVPQSLPMPTDPRKFEFREQYNRMLTPGGKPIAYDPQQPAVNLPDGVLQSAFPPTDQEILEAKSKLWRDDYLPKLIMVNNIAVNQREVVSDFLKKTTNFDEDFRRRRAQSYKCYLEPGALTISPRMDQAAKGAPAVEDIWFSQMSLWIQQDICNAIARMNQKSKTIPTSPVKHLVAATVRQDASMYVVSGGLQPVGPEVAAAPPPMEEFPSEEGASIDDGSGFAAPAAAAPAKNYALSPTGRVCNPLYDVVHYEFIVVVDRQLARKFLEMLQYGRFITVLEADMQNIDLAEAVSSGYDYGSRPVVEMRIKCEAMFLRDWTAHNNGPMPQIVRRMLGIAPQPATPPAAPEAFAQQP